MKLFDILLFIALFSGIAVMAWGIQNEKTEGSKCIDNPLVYGVKYHTENQGNLSCMCIWQDTNKGSFEVFPEGIKPTYRVRGFEYTPTE